MASSWRKLKMLFRDKEGYLCLYVRYVISGGTLVQIKHMHKTSVLAYKL
jgi:hypothetical protein